MTRDDGSQERHDWQVLGEEDPLWAVLMRPGTKHGRWDPQAFLRAGRAEVEAAMGHLAVLGVTPGSDEALDFGCGAGRTALALLGHVRHVVGIDVSEGMLATARSLAPPDADVDFVLTDADGLSAVADGSLDVVYSSLVIQHLPRAQGLRALSEMARITRPGGVVIVQVATATLRNPKGYLFRYCPWPLLRFGQRVVLRYPAPMRMTSVSAQQVASAFAPHGVQVRDRVEDLTYGGHWTYHRYFAVKPT